LERNVQSQPSLREIAGYLGLSEYHFQRLFTHWVGISPKRFLQYLTKERAKALLEQSHNLLEVTYATGLSGPGRLHDLFVSCEAVTPGEFKQRGEGLDVVYGSHPSPFGECLIALTERGICSLAFVSPGERQAAFAQLQHHWRRARLRQNQDETGPVAQQVFNFFSGGPTSSLSLYLNGTNFQIKVWEALLRIPSGSVVSYEDVAMAIGAPRSSRAVSNAIGQNPIPVLVPCHRVIRKIGEFGGYHWGTARKKALLGWEQAHAEGQAGQVER
jgi:AraC family transcriptional regulator of adaptative response/methylated-DNA-[protein]-cysteine methyltransferase